MIESFAEDFPLRTHYWAANQDAVAVLLIVHGMGEYGERYAPFAQYMAARGVHVYAPDLRGHGGDGSEEQPAGHFADQDGWRLVLRDIDGLMARIRLIHPGLPLFLFGHSMGSLIARCLMHEAGDELAGVVHSAASGPQGLAARVGKELARYEMIRLGPRGYSLRLAALLSANFNRRIPSVRTTFDWLSRDVAEVDKYIADPRIIKSFTAAFYRDMFGGTLAAEKPHAMAKTPAELPLLFISGGEDPLGQYGKGLARTKRAYEKAGVRDVTLKVYPDARHELFQEAERDAVMHDIWVWLQARLPHRDEPVPHA